MRLSMSARQSCGCFDAAFEVAAAQTLLSLLRPVVLWLVATVCVGLLVGALMYKVAFTYLRQSGIRIKRAHCTSIKEVCLLFRRRCPRCSLLTLFPPKDEHPEMWAKAVCPNQNCGHKFCALCKEEVGFVPS